MTSATRLTPEEITNRGFASAFRGVSETEVRNFLRRVADELAAVRDHERSLSERVADLEEQLRTPPPLDEKQLLEALGEETTRVLRSAQDAAADIRTRAEEESSATLHEASADARRLREEAEARATERTSSAEAAAADRERESIERADATRAAAELAAAEAAERAATDADAEMERARESGRAIVEEARTVRERVLTDLARRRALMEAQLDELRTGREQLLDAYRVVKQTLADAITALSSVQAKAHAEGGIQIEPVPRDGVDFSLDARREAPDDASPATSRPAADANGAAAPEPPGSEPASSGSGLEKAEESPASATAVDALFARLKEERAEPPPEAEPAQGSRPSPVPGPDPVTVDLATEESPASSRPAPPAPPPPAPEPEPGPDPALVARDEAVAKVRSALGRRAKRALQDEQNELLEALRKTKGRPAADAVLPTVEAQSETWADVLAPGVDEVYRAAARVTAPDAGTDGAPRDFLLAQAAELGTPLRERLVSAFSADPAPAPAPGDPGDESEGDVAQRIGSRYREWRTQSLDGALADASVAAWARGTIDAAPDDARLRWVTPVGGCCPDCDDDALEATPRGEAFPTGHATPPAHPGCRCVVVVETGVVVTQGGRGPRAESDSSDL